MIVGVHCLAQQFATSKFSINPTAHPFTWHKLNLIKKAYIGVAFYSDLSGNFILQDKRQ
jgi:hypothetical protein